ncbi:MAG: DUF389 domain-containing protein [Chloroflexi bacterium]|nr:DUF389 domain-containing protein [Chloroflexota bacterium]
MFPRIPSYLPTTLPDLLTTVRVRLLFLWRRLLPPPDRERRAEVQLQLRDASEPDFDYFVMVLLSCTIATLGLLIDSAATIIGAMLVAPLMSPILGLGLASIRGDTILLRNAAAALIRGALLAVALSVVITWVNSKLPFISLQELPLEIVARTRPSPIDLGVAVAGGLAATFALVQPNLSAALPGVAIATALMPPLCTIGIGLALGDWEVASGATLLFITNAVTIAASAIALFFAMGFSPRRKEGEGLLPHSLVISAILTAVLLAPLGYQSYQFVQQAQRSALINDVLREEVAKIADVELVSVSSNQVGDTLEIEMTVRTIEPLNYQDSVALREAIDVQLQQPVQLRINQVFAARLDPRIPPTQTPTPQLSITPTLTPTSTATSAPTLTASSTATASPTPTPALAVLSNTYGQASISLRQSPGGPTIGYLSRGAILTVLYGYEIVDGWVWIEVQDAGGRIGWIPQFYTELLVAPATATATVAQ